MTAIRVVLLLAAVAGAVARPLRLPAFVAPAACSAIALAAGLVSLGQVGSALRPLAAPLGFLLAAIPLAVLLDRYGYFQQLAGLFDGGRLLVPGLWALATGTVAVLNLDAGVVLLTPLYLRVADQQGRSRAFLGFQPVLLALLASSFLPVSNLTNLVVAARFGVGPLAVLEHLALPSAAACAVGYLCYRAAGGVAEPGRRTSVRPPGGAGPVDPPARDRRVLAVGSLVVALVLAGFVLGPSAGIAEWEVALVADLVLVGLTRYLPLRAIPWDTALVAAGLAILAAAAATGLHLGALLGGSGPVAALRQAAVSAAGANVVNNLPALLVALPFVSSSGGHASCSLWPVLWGVNAGPSLLVTGSLASLLWLDSMRRFGVRVTALQYFRMGVRVALPAAAAGLLVLIALAPALGCA